MQLLRRAAALLSPLVIACGAGPGPGSPTDKVTVNVGPAGSIVSLTGGPSLTFPPGALASTTAVTIERAPAGAPAGALSPLYAFGPAGMPLAVKATVQIPVDAQVTAATVFWASPGQSGVYEALPTAVSQGVASAQVGSLQLGFVGPHCVENAACTPAAACHFGTARCGSGQLVCEDTGLDLPDGAACGGGATCQAGVCPGASRPTIASFTATPPAIAAGQSSTLSWSVEAADALAIDQGVGDVTGSTSRSVTPGTTTTYTLTATNAAGSTSQAVTVTVSPGGGGGSVTAIFLDNVTVAPGATVDLVAAPLTVISGGSATDCEWSVDDATSSTWPKTPGTRPTCAGACGTVSASGVYTAPSVTSTTAFRVRATSKADPSVGDWSIVTVQP